MANEEFRKTFVENLNFYMKVNHKNQMDLICDLGFSSSTISNWCTGKKLPRMNKIELLAEYFGVEKSDLIEKKETEGTRTVSITDQDARMLYYYHRLDEEGRKKLMERADELNRLGYTRVGKRKRRREESEH